MHRRESRKKDTHQYVTGVILWVVGHGQGVKKDRGIDFHFDPIYFC